MRETVFQTNSISKKYKLGLALDNVSMEIKRGEIYGFIGENGAGKTTMIRLLAGLAHPTAGEMSLFGHKGGELTEQRKRIGSIVESPALYPDMTARENLELHRIQKGIPDKGSIDKALKMVNLSDTGKKKAKNFSLGMKQRLGLAVALLNEPEFLVLDEPVNGLDPSGIVELRELLKRLNKEKEVTILVSSHILSELYQLATCYGFIHRGRMLEQLSAKDLDEKCKKHILLKVDNAPKAATILETKLLTTKYEVHPGNTIKLYDFLEESGKISRELNAGGVIVEEIAPKGDDLEGYFLRLIGGAKNA